MQLEKNTHDFALLSNGGLNESETKHRMDS